MKRYLKTYETFEPEEEWEEELPYDELSDDELVMGEVYTVLDTPFYMIGRIISLNPEESDEGSDRGYANFISFYSNLSNKNGSNSFDPYSRWAYRDRIRKNGDKYRYIRNSTPEEMNWFLECEKINGFIPPDPYIIENIDKV